MHAACQSMLKEDGEKIKRRYVHTATTTTIAAIEVKDSKMKLAVNVCC